MSKQENKAVYQKLMEAAGTGFLALDEGIQQEIIQFIRNQQHENGAFTDRAGSPDLYYSLFGMWLCAATGQSLCLEKLKGFVETNTQKTSSPVEAIASILIKTELGVEDEEKSLLKLIRTVLGKGRTIELSYQFFLLALVVDVMGKRKKIFYFFARFWLFFYQPKGNIPCSLNSALIYAKKLVGLNTKSLQQHLTGFIVESGGFRAFQSLETADSLSTGVALFVLEEIGYDLRLIKPGCLDFIQDNYSDGAFLSGDGDQTKDLEYTFYGLLALGSLMKDKKDLEYKQE